jgi:hypothetical protein
MGEQSLMPHGRQPSASTRLTAGVLDARATYQRHSIAAEENFGGFLLFPAMRNGDFHSFD